MSTRRLNPVAWSEGMFLRPHHLQHREIYGDERLRYHLRSLNPFHWGVRDLEIDEEALSDNRFEILRLDAVLPGGMIVRYPGNAVVESREFDPSSERLDVFVGLRNLNPGQPNVASPQNGSRDLRMKIQTEELPDWNRGGSEEPIELAFPNVRVFLSGEEADLEVYESFKIAEVVGTGELKRPFALSGTYAPPLLALQGSPLLNEEVTKIVSQIASKVRVVAGRTTTIAIGDLPRFWMRYTLARMTPVLRHLLSTGQTLPFDVYTALVECAGALATFSSTEAVELPPYDHEDLYRCFKELIGRIETELEKTLPVKFQEFVLAFDPAKKIYSTGELNVQLVDPRNSFYLGVKAPLETKELARWVVEEGKASSTAGVAPLVMLNTRGLNLEHLSGPPTEIAARTGFEYFKVEPHGTHWNKVREDYSFGISLGKLENAEARLYIVLPE